MSLVKLHVQDTGADMHGKGYVVLVAPGDSR